jgi:hypothetical protein
MALWTYCWSTSLSSFELSSLSNYSLSPSSLIEGLMLMLLLTEDMLLIPSERWATLPLMAPSLNTTILPLPLWSQEALLLESESFESALF